jgi:hypothetical protein
VPANHNRTCFQAVTHLSERRKRIDWGTGEGEERASVVPVILHSSFILHPSSHRCPTAERNDTADQVDCDAGADRHGQRGQVRAPSSGSEPGPTQSRKSPRTMRPRALSKAAACPRTTFGSPVALSLIPCCRQRLLLVLPIFLFLAPLFLNARLPLSGFSLPPFQLFASWPVEQRALDLLRAGGDPD